MSKTSDLDALLNELESVEPAPTKRKRAPAPDKYVKILDFNPDSHQDVQALAKHYGVKLPRRKDSDDEEALSTEKKYLKQAAKKHPGVWTQCLECRERWKMISTYKWDRSIAIEFTP